GIASTGERSVINPAIMIAGLIFGSDCILMMLNEVGNFLDRRRSLGQLIHKTVKHMNHVRPDVERHIAASGCSPALILDAIIQPDFATTKMNQSRRQIG